jgi:dethiobiotin synthetase/adenosylmethionine--8-amino-7-oxononanoate aminotransferase
VQTGHPVDSDERLVAGTAALAAARHAGGGASSSSSSSSFRTLFAYRDPVSPHLAAAREGAAPVPDEELVRAVARELRAFGAAGSTSATTSPPLSVVETAGGVLSPGVSGSPQADVLRPLRLPALLVGDARLGGISATLCAYESLMLRGHDVAAVVLLEREGEEGAEAAASGTSSSSPSLGNAAALRHALSDAAAHRLGEPLPVLTLPPVPPPPPAEGDEGASAAVDAGVRAWLREASPRLRALLARLDALHAKRLDDLRTSAQRASACVWWPFTQHGALPASRAPGSSPSSSSLGVTVVDARAGEDWLVFREGSVAVASSDDSGASARPPPPLPPPMLVPAYDAASSWWTQVAGGGSGGAGARAQAEVTRALASAAGRYAHVMWPQVAHAPGLRLSEALVHGALGRGWASRAFFSDDGSTGVEVALKAAMRRFALDRGLSRALWPDDDDEEEEQDEQPQSRLPEQGFGVLALANGYHGDTLGAMECAAPSAFNGPAQFPWYGRAGGRASLYLEPPYVALEAGRWVARLPAWLDGDEGGEGEGAEAAAAKVVEWPTRAALFDLPKRAQSPLARLYARAVERAMDEHEGEEEEEQERKGGGDSSSAPRPGKKRRLLAALLLEPVLQGAGGMLMVDPLFQAVLASVARRTRRMPVVYDEVFTGCWRLGVPRAAELLRLGDGGGQAAAGCDSRNSSNASDPDPSLTDPSLPDLAVYAKLLTGGAAPLAATLASERVFAAFSHASSLARALLHGHSYTAYPAGCSAALASLHALQSPRLNPNVCAPAGGGGGGGGGGQGVAAAAAATCERARRQGDGSACCSGPCGRTLDQWDESAAADLSQHPLVRRVVAIGTVLAVEVRGAPELAAEAEAAAEGGSSGGGYASRSASAAVIEALRARGFAARPLGPVVYVVATPTTPREACARVMAEVRAALDQVLSAGGGGGGGGGVGVGASASAACLV